MSIAKPHQLESATSAEKLSYPDKLRLEAIKTLASRLNLTDESKLEKVWDATAEALIENYFVDYKTQENLQWIKREEDIEYIVERAVTRALSENFVSLKSVDDSDAAVRTLLEQTLIESEVKDTIEQRILECRTERESATAIWRYLQAIIKEQSDNGKGAADEMIIEFQAFLAEYSDIKLSDDEIWGLIHSVVEPANNPDSNRHNVYSFEVDYAAELDGKDDEKFDAASEVRKILEQNEMKKLEAKYYQLRNSIRSTLRKNPETRINFLQTIADHSWEAVGYSKDYDLVGREKDDKIPVEIDTLDHLITYRKVA